VEVWTEATGPRSTCATKLAQMKTAAEVEVDGAVNIIEEKSVEFQFCLSDAETDTTTWSNADIDRIVKHLESAIYGITCQDQMRFKEGFSIQLIKLETCWQRIGMLELRNTIKQRMIHFGYPEMHRVSQTLESIQRMCSGDNFTADISEWLHIGNGKEAYQSSNKVNYIRKMLKNKGQCPILDYMEEILWYLSLQGSHLIDSVKLFNLLSAADKWRNTHRAHLLHFHHCQQEPIFCPVSQQVHYLSNTHVCGVCGSIKLTSLRDALVDVEIPKFGQLFRTQIQENWGHEVSGLVLAYDKNVLIDSIFIKLPNVLLYYSQPFHCPTAVEHLRLDCKVEYTNAIQGIKPESDNILVQFTDSDLDDTLKGRVASFLVLYVSWTPPNHILQFQEYLPAGQTICTFSLRCKKTQQWILLPQPQEYAVVIPTKYKDLHGWADCVDGFIQVVKQTGKMHIVSVGAIVGSAHLV